MTKGDLLPIQDLLGYALGTPDEAERARLVQSAYWSLTAVINDDAPTVAGKHYPDCTVSA